MLYNLKAVYLKRGDLRKALGISELILAIFPWDLDEIRDRGMLHLRLGENAAARRDLGLYLRYRADARDADAVRRTLEAMRSRGD
jgi:regulator of sirC expression with transglutaminase-like and TPR domain